MHIKILTAPGLYGSGSGHWQTLWELSPEVRRIEQADWDAPERALWVAEMEAVVGMTGPDVVIAAHSLGCITTVHWALQTQLTIRGALLVAPADVERPSFTKDAIGFAPIPMVRLPFRTIVVASANDEYTALSRSMRFAAAWGSRFVHAGDAGHINSASGLGDWEAGKKLIRELMEL